MEISSHLFVNTFLLWQPEPTRLGTRKNRTVKRPERLLLLRRRGGRACEAWTHACNNRASASLQNKKLFAPGGQQNKIASCEENLKKMRQDQNMQAPSKRATTSNAAADRTLISWRPNSLHSRKKAVHWCGPCTAPPATKAQTLAENHGWESIKDLLIGNRGSNTQENR